MTAHETDDDLEAEPEATDEETDDESVLLTESAPGSVLPPEEPESNEAEADQAEAAGYDEEPETEPDELVEYDEVAGAPTDEPSEDDEVAEAAEAIEAADAGRPVEPSPLEKLEPVPPGEAVDPGVGTYAERWGAIQTGFIDDPHRAVESASALLAEMWDAAQRSIAEQRHGIDGRWQDAESSTDDLRAVMQDYRDVYARLVELANPASGELTTTRSSSTAVTAVHGT